MEKLAILGGERALKNVPEAELFKWPIIGEEDEQAALEVIRGNKYSQVDITEQFEEEFAQCIGTKHAVAYCNGTASLAAAMFAVGLGQGDEVICPTKTYWASIAQSVALGATPVFCNVDKHLSIDPAAIDYMLHAKQLCNFISAVTDGEKLVCDMYDGKRAVELIEQIYKFSENNS